MATGGTPEFDSSEPRRPIARALRGALRCYALNVDGGGTLVDSGFAGGPVSLG